MSFQTARKVNLKYVLPKEIRESLVCYTLLNSRVVDGAPDIATCNTNGYMYEIKNRKILRSLNLKDNPSSLSCYYLKEGNKLVLFYLIFTSCYHLLIIRESNKRLKVVKEFNEVKEFQVYDFECLGFPQIKINFFNNPESFTCNFPVETLTERNFNILESTLPNSLSEELEDLNKYIDELTEECNQLKKMCASKNLPKDMEKIPISSPNIPLSLSNLTENQLIVESKWFKVLGTFLVLGMTLKNLSNKTIHGLDVIINHKKIKDYAFSLFQSSSDISCYFFSSKRFDGSIKPGEEICTVGSFEIPEFYTESDLIFDCYVVSKNFKDCFVKETVQINLRDIAIQTTVDLEERFSVEDLLAVLTVKTETQFKIQTEDFAEDLLESLLVKYLGFKLISHLKDKFFYCTSTYLKEVFVALQHIAKNPSVWRMAIYTSWQEQIYFLVNALYDLLPENSAVLLDEIAD